MSYIHKLVDNYRKVYVTIKIYPFIYTVVLLIICPLEAWMTLKWAEVLALLTSTSIPTFWLYWRLSKAVELCLWHRTQCFIMLLSLTIPLCRIIMPDVSIFWVWGGVTVLLVASLVNTYFVFVRPSHRE